jgi:hypothetical protein
MVHNQGARQSSSSTTYLERSLAFRDDPENQVPSVEALEDDDYG